MRLDVWCSRIPYIDHAAPVWRALPRWTRGTFRVSDRVLDHALSLGLPAVAKQVPQGTAPVLILSRCEFSYLPPRPLFFLEHGVGPAYEGRSHLPDHEGIELVMTTPANAPAHLERFGDRVEVVGCPKLDRLPRPPRAHRRPVIAISHHWDQLTHPETRSAWPWDKEAIERLVASGRYTVLGHKHPGDPRGVQEWFASIGAEYVSGFAQIMARADLYIADNSSTLYEFAATGRPVVVLSPPFYRRDVDHGLRFWRHVPGAQVNHPDELEAVIAEALVDTPQRQASRAAAVEAAYGPLDGHASERAVEAIHAALERLSRDTRTTIDRRDRTMGVTIIRSRKGTDMGQTVTTPKRLYKTNQATGITELAYPAGAAVPVEEYRELSGSKKLPADPAQPAAAPLEHALDGTTETEVKAGKALSKMNRRELVETAAEEGVDITGCDTNKKIAEAITKKRSAK